MRSSWAATAGIPIPEGQDGEAPEELEAAPAPAPKRGRKAAQAE